MTSLCCNIVLWTQLQRLQEADKAAVAPHAFNCLMMHLFRQNTLLGEMHLCADELFCPMYMHVALESALAGLVESVLHTYYSAHM